MGRPSLSTISTCSTSHSSALPFLMSERTAGICSARSSCRSNWAGFCPRRSAIRSTSTCNLVVGDLDLLGVGDRPQGEIGLHRRRRALAQLLDELLLGLAGGLEVLGDGGALGLQPMGQVMGPTLELGLDQRLRRVFGHQLDHGLDDLIAQGHAGLHPLHAADALDQVLAQLLHRVELRGLAKPTRR